MKCNECGKPVDLKIGDEITTEIGPMKVGGEPTLCRACLSKGWSVGSARDILNDPELRGAINIKSPIQQEDL